MNCFLSQNLFHTTKIYSGLYLAAYNNIYLHFLSQMHLNSRVVKYFRMKLKESHWQIKHVDALSRYYSLSFDENVIVLIRRWLHTILPPYRTQHSAYTWYPGQRVKGFFFMRSLSLAWTRPAERTMREIGFVAIWNLSP